MPENMPPLPVPRDADAATFSELVPFRSKKIRLHRSPVLWFVAVTAVFNVLLFVLRIAVLNGETAKDQVGAFLLIVQASLFYMLALAVLGLHAYAKTDKHLTYYVFPALFVYAFMHSPLWPLIYGPFDLLAGGDLMEKSPSWPVRLYGAICGPGLREELVKALPVLLGAAITLRPATFGFLPTRLRELLRVRGPLDGVLMGFAAGAAFLFAETGGQYISTALREYMQASRGNLPGAFGSALMLLLPRVMNGWVGHMAWSGIVGYAIGLALVRRRQAATILLGGWAVAAVLHGLWDSRPPAIPYSWVLIGGVGGLLAISCLVKARQLETALFGRAQESFGSIVALGAPPLAPTPVVPVAAATAPAIAVGPRPAPAPGLAPAAAQAQAPAAAASLGLQVGGVLLPLRAGAWMDFAREPALGGRGAGITAEVTRHPTRPDVLGLKNLGGAPWRATLRDGTVQPIAPERSLRLQAGVSVDFGGGLVGRVVPA